MPGLHTYGKLTTEQADNDKKQRANIVTLTTTIPFKITSPALGLLLICLPYSDGFIPLDAKNSSELCRKSVSASRLTK